MDDTLADESGIPVIANSDDIPVHSTPIKGTRIPLPSTRHVMKALFEKGKPYTLSEQEISELPNVPEEKSIFSYKSVGHGQGLTEGNEKQFAQLDTERDRKDIDNIVKSLEEKVLFTTRQVSSSLDNFRVDSNEKERDHHLHYHPRSASDSNTRFHPSSHDYRREDNLRTHFHSKHSKSQSSGPSLHNDMRSDISHEKDRRPYSPNRFDKSSNRTNRESKFDDKIVSLQQNENSPKYVHKSDGQLYSKDSFHDISPRTNCQKIADSSIKHDNKQRGDVYLESSHADAIKTEQTVSDIAQSQSDKTHPNELKSDTFYNETSKTHFASGKNSNAFSSYAFNRESRKPHRHLYGDLDLTPENKSHGRLRDRTTEMSPLARRRAVPDTLGEQSGAGMKSLSTSVKQASYSEMEVSTIQKQRQEIQLLVTELKDRDRELGDMMNSHQQQLLAWEQDRQRVITLDRKCTQYEADLQAKSTQLHNVHKALKALKSKQATQTEEAEINKITVDRLLRENDQLKQQLAQYQDKCEMLQKTVQELSNSVGRLQAREEELNTSLKLKEKDIISATNQMKELSDRLRLLDSKCKECQDREKEAVKEKNEWRQKYENGTTELQSLRDAVDGKSKQVSQLEEELLSLRHHLSVLQRDNGMREKCQEELLESMRIKQERTDSQLKSFRELYEHQLRELSKLQLQLDTSKGIITKQQSSLDEQQLSGSYSIRGNSRLSDRSLDRQRNTVVQTSRYRDPDSDVHISQQQSSGYQTQVSGNQSELLETQSTATGSQLLFQPYRINHGEGVPSGYKNDNDYAKFSQDKLRPKEKKYSSDDVFIRQEGSPKHVRLKGVEQKPPTGKETSAKRPVPSVDGAINTRTPPGSPRTAHSELLSVLPQTNPQPYNTMQNSPPRKGGYVIEQTSAQSSLPVSVQSQDKELTGKEKQTTDPRRNGCTVQRTETQHQETYSDRQYSDHRTDLQGQRTETQRQEMYSDRQNSDDRTDLSGQETGAENQYSDPHVFENRLCSFLEDMEEIDDAIWDEQGNISKLIPQGEGGNSPASKLFNLLLESRKMIQSLEETASPPTSRQGPQSEGQGDQK